ncbi:MAG: sulfite exporter TauE/SafE family protein [Candidatus Woesearchaeota archaeon]
MEYLVLALIGLGVGVLTGIFGIGGGSVRIPLLVLTGMPLVVAFATNMFAIPFSSAVGAYIHRRNIAWDSVVPFTIGGVFGIVIATFFVGVVSSRVLAILFFAAAIITVIGLYLDRISHQASSLIERTPRSLFLAALIGNLIIGARGGSGGTLFPPLLRALHIDMHPAIATSLFAGFFSSIAALIIYGIGGHVLVVPGVIIAGFGIIGSIIGSHVSLHIDGKHLAIGLSVTVILLAISVLYGEFF